MLKGISSCFPRLRNEMKVNQNFCKINKRWRGGDDKQEKTPKNKSENKS
jgi:hypothetical protein